jgi:hypothetical protein
MKSQSTLSPTVAPLDAYTISEGFIRKDFKKIRKQSVIPPPPDEESCSRLNAMAREYPFCIYYREKSNDPL